MMFDNLVSYMIYSYFVFKGICYVIDIKLKICVFCVFSFFFLIMERDFGVGMRKV